MERRAEFGNYQNIAFSYRKLKFSEESPASINGDFSFSGSTDRRFTYSCQPSFHQPKPHTPISINDSTTNVYSSSYDKVENFADVSKGGFLDENLSVVSFVIKSAKSGNK